MIDNARISIAIDGPGGAGKSTIARIISRKLNILYLDTGAMYRALALFAVRRGVTLDDESGVRELLDDADISVKYVGGGQITFLNGEDVSSEIRRHDMSKAASDISALPIVRYKMAELQRSIAQTCDMVLDGRDIGTFVLPDASIKFFLTADVKERARRRTAELLARGQRADIEQVLRDIELRDKNDSQRAVAPLRQADDAIVVDSTHLNIEEVAALMLKHIAALR